MGRGMLSFNEKLNEIAVLKHNYFRTMIAMMCELREPVPADPPSIDCSVAACQGVQHHGTTATFSRFRCVTDSMADPSGDWLYVLESLRYKMTNSGVRPEDSGYLREGSISRPVCFLSLNGSAV